MKNKLKKIFCSFIAIVMIFCTCCASVTNAYAVETVKGSFNYLWNYVDENAQKIINEMTGIMSTKSINFDKYKTVYSIIYLDKENTSIYFFSVYLNLISGITTGCILELKKDDTSYGVYLADDRDNTTATGEAMVNPKIYSGSVNFSITIDGEESTNLQKQTLFNTVFRKSLDLWEEILQDKAHISLANFGFKKLGYNAIDINEKFNGLIHINSGLYYYTNGNPDKTFKGLAKYESTWYYVSNGTVDTSYVGMASNDYGVWYVKNGTIDFKYNGVVEYNSTWVYVKNGKLDTSFTGLVKYNSTWWYFSEGKLDVNYVGLGKNQYGWWYVKDGQIDFSYTGMAKNQYGWWYVTKGKLDTKYTGMAKNDYGWWYITNGKLDTTYTGMAKNQYGWWYLSKGKIDYSYKGLAKNDYGWWYISKGTIDYTYNGYASNQYGTWRVVNGKVR